MATRLKTFCGAAAGATAIAAVLEALLRALPVSTASMTGYAVDPMILTPPPGHRFVVSAGWDLRHPQTLRINNLGFASEHSFEPDSKAIAFVGDSLVEASALASGQRPAEQLQARLQPGASVFGMGGPGSSLLDYAERIRLATDRLHVREFVVLMERGDVRQSLCGPFSNTHGPCIDPSNLIAQLQSRPEGGKLKTWLRHSALAQYLFSQLKISPDSLLPTLRSLPASLLPQLGAHAKSPKSNDVGSAVRDGPTHAAIDRVVQMFFERASPHLIRPVVFIINNSPDERALTDDRLNGEIQRFTDAARARGHIVVELAPYLMSHQSDSRLSPYVAPFDRHYNSIGASIVARAAADGLRLARRLPNLQPDS